MNRFGNHEPFINAREAALFLGFDPVKGAKTILRWARAGYIPAHPLGEGKRRLWRFLLSELKEWMRKRRNDKESD